MSGDNNGSAVGLMVIAMAFLASVILVFLVPLYMVYKYFSMKKDINNLNDLVENNTEMLTAIRPSVPIKRCLFWLSDDDKHSIKELSDERDRLRGTIRGANDKGNASGISRNMDCTFSKRSALGKKLAEIVSDSTDKLKTIERNIRNLEVAPELEWQRAYSAVNEFLEYEHDCRKTLAKVTKIAKAPIYALYLWILGCIWTIYTYDVLSNIDDISWEAWIPFIIASGISVAVFKSTEIYFRKKQIDVKVLDDYIDILPEHPPRVTLGRLDELSRCDSVNIVINGLIENKVG